MNLGDPNRRSLAQKEAPALPCGIRNVRSATEIHKRQGEHFVRHLRFLWIKDQADRVLRLRLTIVGGQFRKMVVKKASDVRREIRKR